MQLFLNYSSANDITIQNRVLLTHKKGDGGSIVKKENTKCKHAFNLLYGPNYYDNDCGYFAISA